MTESEIRSTSPKFEVRSDDNKMTVTGYALTFNQPSQDLGGFIEYLDPKALDGVDLSNVSLLYGHDFNNILAKTSAGTLELKIDNKGLAFTAQLPNTTTGRDTFENIQNGNLSGCSFQFSVKEDEWSTAEDGTQVRVIKSIDQLPEITITSIPAYTQTSVTVKRHLENIDKEPFMAEDMAEDITEKRDEAEATEPEAVEPTEDAKETVDQAEFDALKKQYDLLAKAVEKLEAEVEPESEDDKEDTDTEDASQDQSTEKESRSMKSN